MAKDIFGDADVEMVDASDVATVTTNDFAATMAAATGGQGGKLGDMLKGMDMSKVKDGYTIVPDNTQCLLDIKKVEVVKTKNNDNMLRLTLSVVEPEEFAGAKCWDNVVLIPSSLWKFKALAKATDMISTDGQFTGDDEQDFVDKQIVATLLETEYENKAGQMVPKNEVKGGYEHPSKFTGSGTSAGPSF